MGAVPAIVDLERTGHRLTVDAGRLVVDHASTLTAAQRSGIRKHRDRIVELVTDQQRMVEQGWTPVWMPALTDEELETEHAR